MSESRILAVKIDGSCLTSLMSLLRKQRLQSRSISVKF